MRRTVLALTLLSALPLAATTSARSPHTTAPRQTASLEVREEKLHSATLRRDVPYRILLPSGYAQSARPHPVLYLLHGVGGDYRNWTDKTTIASVAGSLDVVIVTPEGDNSWYVNGENGEGWETYLLDELIPNVQSKYRVSTSRDGRGIAGLSMGGYGAIKSGLKRPAMFSFAGALSGAFDITREHDIFTTASHMDLTPIFGKPGSETRAGNDVYALAAKADPKSLPYLYLTEGTSDPWLEPNRDLARVLSSAKIAYEYHESPGTHDWTFWDREIGGVIAAFLRPR